MGKLKTVKKFHKRQKKFRGFIIKKKVTNPEDNELLNHLASYIRHTI